jgi:hypothetical protein
MLCFVAVSEHLLELEDLLHDEVVLVLHEEGVVPTRVPGVARVKPKIKLLLYTLHRNNNKKVLFFPEFHQELPPINEA